MILWFLVERLKRNARFRKCLCDQRVRITIRHCPSSSCRLHPGLAAKAARVAASGFLGTNYDGKALQLQPLHGFWSHASCGCFTAPARTHTASLPHGSCLAASARSEALFSHRLWTDCYFSVWSHMVIIEDVNH